jgi:hypothetical protein
MLCPILNKECIKGDCEWYSTIYDNTCAIPALEILLSELKESLEPASP